MGSGALQFQQNKVVTNWGLSQRTAGDVFVFDDFMNEAFDADGPWDAVQTVNAGTAWVKLDTAGQPSAGHGGWIAATTDTASGDTEALFGPLAFKAERAVAGRLMVFEALLLLPSITDVGMSAGFTDARTETAVVAGFTTATWTTTADNGVHMNWDSSATTDAIRGIGTKATVDTAAVVNTGVNPTADKPFKFRIIVDSAGMAYFASVSPADTSARDREPELFGSVADAVTTTTLLCPYIEVTTRTNGAKTLECDYILAGCAR